MQTSSDPVFGGVISSYSRAQALEDGFLVDVSAMAKEAGFVVPVAVTKAVWEDCVAVPKGTTCQDEKGRLWDVLSMCRLAARRTSGDSISFLLSVRKGRRQVRTLLKALCGPGDTMDPVITILLSNED